MKYQMMVTYEAEKFFTIEADSEEDALEKSYEYLDKETIPTKPNDIMSIDIDVICEETEFD